MNNQNARLHRQGMVQGDNKSIIIFLCVASLIQLQLLLEIIWSNRFIDCGWYYVNIFLDMLLFYIAIRQTRKKSSDWLLAMITITLRYIPIILWSLYTIYDNLRNQSQYNNIDFSAVANTFLYIVILWCIFVYVTSVIILLNIKRYYHK